MIFLTLGTQKFQFNRLLKEIDLMVQNGNINNDVIAQTGFSTYKPHNYTYFKFLDRITYDKYIEQSDMVITHAGVGSILEAKRNNKPVIVVPRLMKYNEHVDNHQCEIAKAFSKKKLVFECEELSNLPRVLELSKHHRLLPYISNNNFFVKKIENAIYKLKCE